MHDRTPPRRLSPDTQRHQPTCWMLCTAEFVSSPTLPVNSGSFSGYSLKAVSSGTGAPASSSGFCFLLWLRLAAFPCLPSASSSCSRPSAGCKEIGVSNHQGSGLHLDGALPPSHPRASSCHRERLNIVRGEVFPLWGVQLKERASEPLSTAGTTLGVNAWLELCRHLLPLSAQARLEVRGTVAVGLLVLSWYSVPLCGPGADRPTQNWSGMGWRDFFPPSHMNCQAHKWLIEGLDVDSIHSFHKTWPPELTGH